MKKSSVPATLTIAGVLAGRYESTRDALSAMHARMAAEADGWSCPRKINRADDAAYASAYGDYINDIKWAPATVYTISRA